MARSQSLTCLLLAVCVAVCVSSGRAACPDGWEGSDCSIYSEVVEPETPLEGYVGNATWKYYRINIQNGPSILFFDLSLSVFLFFSLKFLD
jgi:hypothetical protein